MDLSTNTPPADKTRSIRWPLVALLLLTLAVYWPVAGFEFSSWDDNINVTENVRFNPPKLTSIGWFWTHSFQKLYIPLAYSGWLLVAIVAQTNSADLSGVKLNPYVFHLANLLLHLVSVAIVYAILKRLLRCARASLPASRGSAEASPSRQIRRLDASENLEICAAIGAAIFAIHPLQVEPVAWITGFRDVLSGLFTAIALQQYVVARDEPAKRAIHFTLATLAYIAAMLCKPMAACLPFIVACIDLFVFHRPARRVAFSILPWLVLAIPIVVASRIAQPSEGQVAASPLWSRPLVSGDAIAFYLWKLILPFPLAMDYGRTPRYVLSHALAYAIWIIPALVGVVAWLIRKRAPWLIAGFAIFVAALLPVLGLIPFGFQAHSTVADRYAYIALLGACVALAGFLASTKRSLAACGFASVILITFAALAHRQVWVWRDDFSLYSKTLAVNSSSYIANNNLAAALLEQRRPADALPYAKRATELDPGQARTWVNLADCLAATGREREAIPAYRRALELEPKHAAARAKLALALASAGDADAARAEFDRAVRDDPDQRRVEPQLIEKIQGGRP